MGIQPCDLEASFFQERADQLLKYIASPIEQSVAHWVCHLTGCSVALAQPCPLFVV